MQSNRRWSWKTFCVNILIIWKYTSGRFLMDWLDMNSKIPAGRANGIPQESVSGWRRWRQEGVQVAGLARTCTPTPSLFTQTEADLPTPSFKLHLLFYVLPHRWQDWRASTSSCLFQFTGEQESIPQALVEKYLYKKYCMYIQQMHQGLHLAEYILFISNYAQPFKWEWKVFQNDNLFCTEIRSNCCNFKLINFCCDREITACPQWPRCPLATNLAKG